MTIVEFFDRTPIENMISCLTVQPDKIVFIGEKKPMKRQEEIYNEFLAEKGLTVEFEFKPINKNSISKIAEVLTEIIETEPDCAFDLTGGDDLVLVAMGIVFERYKNEKNIQMHRFNVRTGTCTDCDNDGILPRTMVPNLSVKENIMLYGGSVMEFDGEKGMAEWEFDDEFISDVEVMWEVCRRDPGLWNTQIATLANVFASSGETDSLYFCAFKSYIENLLEKKSSYVWDAALLGDLETYGFISDYFDDGEMVSFTYKNEQIKRLLSKAGTILELKVFLSAKKLLIQTANRDITTYKQAYT